jgi:hypothetical protein
VPGVEALEMRLTPAGAWLPAQLAVPPAEVGTGGSQVVFFEGNVADYQVLAQGLAAGTQAVVLDPSSDGLDQMASYLSGQHVLSAIHLVSHGVAGALELGTTALDEHAPTTHAADLQALAAALAPQGDLLLWGCDVAAGAAGQTFLNDLAAATGTHVGAAAHLVGAAALGGSWNLDVTVGDVHAAAPFSAAARDSFPGVLLSSFAAAPMSQSRKGETATLLPNGTVLVTGGIGDSGFLSSAELYDPATNSWSSAGNMSTPRYAHAATLLQDGRVLVAGGSYAQGANAIYLSSAEVYDPATNTWSSAANMSDARAFHTATLLPSGRVLVAGGFDGDPNFGYLSSAEVYDPASNSWSSAANMSSGRSNHTATLLPDGQVLVTGGSSRGLLLTSAEFYDEGSNTWSPAAPMIFARSAHTATLLPSGKMLVAGGDAFNPSTSEVYDPLANTWTGAGVLSAMRQFHTATLLPDGTVLVTGGEGGVPFGPQRTTDLYDPASNSWRPGPPLNAPRAQHQAVLLPDGSVLVVGGNDPNAASNAERLLSVATSLVGRDAQSGEWWVGLSNGSDAFTNIPADNWDPSQTWVDVQTGDFNGDGFTDIVGHDLHTGQWWVGLSDGNGHFTTTLWDTWDPTVTWLDVRVGDFDGEGRMDIAGRAQVDGSWWVGLSTGTSFHTSRWGAWDPTVAWEDVQVGDLTGSGKADLIGRTPAGQWWAALSEGSSFRNTFWITWAADAPDLTWADVQLADVNGDGKADLVGRWQQTGQWWVTLSAGGAGGLTTLWTTWDPSVTWVDVHVADVTGDGRADLVGRDLARGGWWVGTSTGTAFANSLWDTWSPAVAWSDVQVADFDGDGRLDLAGRAPDGSWWVGLSSGSSFTTSRWGQWDPSINWVDVHSGAFG